MYEEYIELQKIAIKIAGLGKLLSTSDRVKVTDVALWNAELDSYIDSLNEIREKVNVKYTRKEDNNEGS